MSYLHTQLLINNYYNFKILPPHAKRCVLEILPLNAEEAVGCNLNRLLKKTAEHLNVELCTVSLSCLVHE